MKHIIFKTYSTFTGLILRVTLGLIFLPHGLQKTIGMYGGAGFTGTIKIFTEQLHLPTIIAFAVIIIEFCGAVCLLLGLVTRFWAIAYIGLLLGIMFSTHLENGFFMNWFGNQKGEGCQFDLLAIGIAIALIVEGSGKYSLDTYIFRKRSLISK
ncbi:DoxX family protein [Chryseobacterium jejuense]|uniref:DoxX family protein n=1 Tax=Chryseobacterium jejuense TaxID=445960 RepID=UPI001AE13008|nr:DoxX family protein [Chryseobacterium jejuense]MBP2619716.1 putative oxidoreductase [Chryseobacterium jejuense]